MTGTLAEALERTCALLERSRESDWSPLTPVEVAENLRESLRALEEGRPPNYRLLGVEFAPTSSIQEIAMANGWHDEYMRIALVVDRHVDGRAQR